MSNRDRTANQLEASVCHCGARERSRPGAFSPRDATSSNP